MIESNAGQFAEGFSEQFQGGSAVRRLGGRRALRICYSQEKGWGILSLESCVQGTVEALRLIRSLQ